MEQSQLVEILAKSSAGHPLYMVGERVHLTAPLVISRPVALVGLVIERERGDWPSLVITGPGASLRDVHVLAPVGGGEVLRRQIGIDVRASRIRLDGVVVSEHSTGIRIRRADHVRCARAVVGSTSISIHGQPERAHLSAGIAVVGSRRATVEQCVIYGHGEGVLVGSHAGEQAADCLIADCDISAVADCGIYVSSGERIVIDRCHVEDWDASAIKACGARHVIRDCHVEQSSEYPQRTAVVVSPGHDDTACRTVVHGLTARGDLRRGIWAAPRDGRYPDEVLVRDCDMASTASVSHSVAYEHDPLRTILTVSGARCSGFARV